jgi:paraquat-inducible protein B
MSRRANPTVVGTFVLGAIALAILALVVFGSGSLFRTRPQAVAFFEGNIQGLSIGAPVNLLGVRVGTVTNIRIDINAADATAKIPVYMQFEPERLNIAGASENATRNQAMLKTAIAKGLHARLASQSLVTGQLLVELSFDPKEPARLVGADPSTVEIPTARSDFEKLKEVLSKVPLEDIAATALRVLEDVDKLVTSPELPSLLKSLAEASANLGELTASTRQGLPQLLSSLSETSNSARETLSKAQSTLGEMNGTFKSADRLVSADLRDAVASAKSALQRADKLLADANSLVSASSSQRYDINQILRNLAVATQSLRSLTDELDRRPNAVLLGR